jgi:hypothetical protein
MFSLTKNELKTTDKETIPIPPNIKDKKAYREKFMFAKKTKKRKSAVPTLIKTKNTAKNFEMKKTSFLTGEFKIPKITSSLSSYFISS